MGETGQEPKAPPPRDWGQYWRRRIAAGIAGLLVLVAGAALLLDSPIGHRLIADSLARYAPASGLRVEVGRIEGSILGEATLHDVRLSDPNGVFARVPLVELDWKPLAWFRRGLDIRRLVARRGHLLRLPELNPGAPDAPILPRFDIRIDRFELDDWLIDEQVAGAERRIHLLARADLADGRAKIALASRLGGADRLSARLDMDEAGNAFDIAADYRAPASGLLAALTGIDEDMRAIVAGSGNWQAWQGRALIRRDGANFAALRLTNRAGRYGALGQIYPGDRLTGLAARAVGKALSLKFAGTLKDSTVDGTLRLRGAGFAANTQGAVDLADNAFEDVNARVRLLDPALLGGDLRLAGLSARLVLNGTFRAPAIGYDAAAQQVSLATLRLKGVKAEGEARWQNGRLSVPLRLTARDIETGEALLDRRVAGAVLTGTLAYADDRLRSDSLRLNGPGIAADLAFSGDLRRGLYGLAGPVAAKGLALADLGLADVRAQIVAAIGGTRGFNLRAQVTGEMTRVTNATLANLAGAPIGFTGDVELAANAPILIHDARIDARDLDLAFTGERSRDGTVRLAGSGRHIRFGAFEVEGEIAGDGPRAVLVFADPWPAAGLKEVRVALSPIADGFAIDTSGQSALGPFAGVLELFAPPGGPTRIVVDRLTVSDTQATGRLSLTAAGIAGDLALSGGGVEGTLELAPAAAGQGLSADIVLRNARFAGTTPIAVRIARLRAEGTVGDATTIDAAINAQGISRGNLFIGRLAAEGELRDGSGRFRAQVSGRRGSRFALRLTGDVAPDRIAVAARGRYAGRDISMPRRAVLLRSDGGWQLRRSQIDFAGGRLQAEGRLGDSTQLTLRLANMPLSVGDLLIADLGLGGEASGIVTFRSLPGEAPTGTARLLVEDLTRSGLVLTSRAVDLALVAELTPEDFETRAVIRADANRSGRLQMRISALPPTGDPLTRLRAGRLTGQARYGGPVDALWRLVAVEVFDLTGEVRIAANMRGTLDDPQLRGTIRSDDLRLQSAITGTDVEDIALNGSFDGSALRITRFGGSTGNGGTIAGSGTVDLSDIATRGVGIDFRIAAQQARLLQRDEMAAVVTGPMRIVARDNRGTIAGRLKIVSGRWRLGQATAAQSLPNIATREINLPPDEQPARARMAAWRYLVDLTADDRFTVTGLGLDSEWQAQLRLRGTTAAPVLTGEAELVRGGYEFSGKRFELERGRIRFTGQNPPDPRLNVVAVADVGNINARIAITGPSAAPQIAFSSVPALPEEEVLARLLFGDSIANISAAEALQLGAALAALQGGDGLDPINELRSAIGVDRLRVIGADEALGRGTSLAVGEYLGRDLYVELITDGRGYSATELEYRVTSWLSLLGTISSLGYNSTSVQISRDY